MKDIALYGHLTIDTILDGIKERKSLGSMANVAFVQIFTASTQSLAVDVCPKIFWVIRKRKRKRPTTFTT